MRLGGRIVAMLFAVAGLLGSAPAPAEAAQNCTLTRTGDVYCSDSAAPVRIQVTGRVVQLAANGDSTCALTEPGEVYCWSADGPAEASADETGPDLSPLLLVTVGLLLVGGGVTLVTLGRSGEGRPQDARSKAASRNLSAPSLSRSV
jgi:Regulator of chromosome condensation (RCC1) repeat